jgi:hypothetical protein
MFMARASNTESDLRRIPSAYKTTENTFLVYFTGCGVAAALALFLKQPFTSVFFFFWKQPFVPQMMLFFLELLLQ